MIFNILIQLAKGKIHARYNVVLLSINNLSNRFINI